MIVHLLNLRFTQGVWRWLFLLGIWAVCAGLHAAQTSDPRELVDNTIETLRENVIRDQALIEHDPGHALVLVERILAPHIDMRLASRLVLGKHWKSASELQRDAFVDGLRRLLLRVFAVHVSDYTDAIVGYQPVVLSGADNQRAIVRTDVSRPGAPEVNVDYRLRRTDGKWKIYDVAVLGISLVKTYHVTIESELERSGLDGVIDQINAKSPLKDVSEVRVLGEASHPAG